MRDMGGSFGIRWDLRLWSTRLAIVTFVISVVVMGAHHFPDAFGQGIWDTFVLSPAAVRHGFVWQLITFAFVNIQPFGLLFAIYALVAFGSGVEERLGSRAFLAWFFGLAAVSSLVTVGLSFVSVRVLAQPYFGADAVSLGLLVVWVALHRGAMISFFMLFPMRAEVMLYISLGILILYSIADHPATFAPDFAAFGAAELATRQALDLSPRRAYLRYRAWAIERSLRKKSSKFTVISGGAERNESDDDHKPPDKTWLN